MTCLHSRTTARALAAPALPLLLPLLLLFTLATRAHAQAVASTGAPPATSTPSASCASSSAATSPAPPSPASTAPSVAVETLGEYDAPDGHIVVLRVALARSTGADTARTACAPPSLIASLAEPVTSLRAATPTEQKRSAVFALIGAIAALLLAR